VRNEQRDKGEEQVLDKKQRKDNTLHTLISLDDFKALMGIDDREEKQARFCLTTATLSIEQYCKRSFLRKQYFETFKITGNLIIPLKEYPVTKIISMSSEREPSVRLAMSNGDLIDQVFYRPYPGCAFGEELPFEILLSPSLKPYKLKIINIIYVAGYSMNREKRAESNDQICNHSMKQLDKDCGYAHCSLLVPTDLSAACMELAIWNMNRYRGRRIGVTGNIKGSGTQEEHFEISMPENVRNLIEPYKRKVI
jgi:hypothetical protein